MFFSNFDGYIMVTIEWLELVYMYRCTSVHVCGCGVSTDTGRCNISHDVECADFPANTRYSPNAAPMLGQRRRRWTNIGPALGQSLVFAGLGLWSLSVV